MNKKAKLDIGAGLRLTDIHLTLKPLLRKEPRNVDSRLFDKVEKDLPPRLSNIVRFLHLVNENLSEHDASFCSNHLTALATRLELIEVECNHHLLARISITADGTPHRSRGKGKGRPGGRGGNAANRGGVSKDGNRGRRTGRGRGSATSGGPGE